MKTEILASQAMKIYGAELKLLSIDEVFGSPFCCENLFIPRAWNQCL